MLAAAAALATGAACWIAYARVEGALGADFEQRLARVARTAASQITPDLVEEARRAGEESGGYLALQVQLVTLRSATGVADASLVDTSRVTLVDARAPEETEGQKSPLEAQAREPLDEALAGHTAVSGEYPHEGRRLRAAFSPVMDGARVAAIVAVEAEPAYRATLTALSRRLTLVALFSVAAIAGFAVLIVRSAVSTARLERRLSRAENLAAMGRLTATLAHEIKNPLAIIRGSAERLQASGADAPRMAQFVIEESDRLTRTVARYLQFARTEDGGREAGDAAAALGATLALLQGELESRRIVLERSRGPDDSATVRLDPESLKQVFLNLLLNACEAMPDGGRLRVSDRIVADRFEVEIADEGKGIPPELKRRLGSPFLTTKAQGTGLGLFLTRRLVESSGGALEIESEVGRGTTCVVRLPRARG